MYRVKVSRKPNVSYIELLDNQLEAVPHARKKPGHVRRKTRKTS